MSSRSLVRLSSHALSRSSQSLARLRKFQSGHLVAKNRHPTVREYSIFRQLPKSTNKDCYWICSAIFAVCISTYLLEKPSIRLEAPHQYSSEKGEPFRIDPSTSQSFPILLPKPVTALPTSCGQLQLVGLGVRTVSFLRVKVYVSALYIDSHIMRRLNTMEDWKGFEKAWFMDAKSNHSCEDLISALLDQGISFAIRIVPVRSTDYNHLRDGFTRSIQGRAKLARKKGELAESSDEALSQSLQALKESFPRSSLPKGQALDLLFTPSPSGIGHDLSMEEGGKVLGQIKSPEGSIESQFSVARQLLLAYMANKDEISRPFKESVAEGFEIIVRGNVA